MKSYERTEIVMSDRGQAVRLLRDDEVDAVTGGITGGCIRLPTILPNLPRSPEPFRDVFAKYTIG